MYEVNEIDGAMRTLSGLVESGKTEALVFFYLGRCQQHRLQFERAITQYKEFLKRSKKNDPFT